MPSVASYSLVVLIGYLLGSLNLATLLAKRRGVDLRAGGSGNPGASNTVTLMGWKAGALVAIHDIFKAFLAVWLCRRLFPALPYVGVIAGVCSVLGHIFPFYLRFRGGKGFASYLGMALALDWKFALAIGLVIIIVVLITDYIVAGTMATVVSFPIYNAIRQQYVTALLLAAATLLIIWKHRENLVRICRGTEIGVRSAGKGNYRVK
jgi:acyl-phosphate glycerol 3-phosphate acyltransferase